MNAKHEEPKVRKGWGEFRPTERIHRQGKSGGYNRRRENKSWRRDLE